MIAASIADADRAKREAVINPILSRIKYLTSSQAAELIEVKPSTIRTWENEGKIKAYPTGKNERFLLAEVLEIAEQRVDRKHRF